jgi:hypothetical protein
MVLTETCTAVVSSDRSSSRRSQPSLRRQAFSAPRKRSAGTPPSTFLFLPIHLSNSPEIMGIPLPGDPGSRRSPRHPNAIGRLVTLSVRSFAGAPSRRRRAARRCGAYIVAWSQPCQLSIWQISPQCRAADSTLWHRHIGVPTEPPCRTRATFLPRSLHRGKASGHSTNQGYRASALTCSVGRAIVAASCHATKGVRLDSSGWDCRAQCAVVSGGDRALGSRQTARSKSSAGSIRADRSRQ